MTTPIWEPGVLYPPGSLVQPRTAVPATVTVVDNPGFEALLTDWTPSGPGVWASNAFQPRTGLLSVSWVGTTTVAAPGILESDTQCSVAAGTLVTAFVSPNPYGGPPTQHPGGFVALAWYTAADVLISVSWSGQSGEQNTNWQGLSVTAMAPPTTAYFKVRLMAYADGGGGVAFDDVAISYPGGTGIAGLIYKATQAASGYSDVVEPVWPGAGLTVVDNEVTWEGVNISRVIWEAHPVLKSGAVEPLWPTDLGERVPDNTISWELVSRRVSDVNCPNTPVVVTQDGKVYAADKPENGNNIAFSAVNNPLDWSTPNDAGFLPFGNGKFGSTPVRTLGLYRGNLAAMNGIGFQLWQIDPDPALNSRLDALPVGSIYHKAFAPVSNDSFFLSQLGVRTIGIAASSTNIKAGDVGLPIDPLVQERLNAGFVPKAFYSASAGQYWLVFTEVPLAGQSEVFVFTLSQLGSVGAWSRYVFPFIIDYAVIDEQALVVRSANKIYEVNENYIADLDGEVETDITAVIWFPWLEMGGAIGQDKSMEGFDISGYATSDPLVQFGWDQNNLAAFTPAVAVPYDTVPDSMIPSELTAPSISVKITYTGGGWQFNAMNVYLEGRRLAR